MKEITLKTKLEIELDLRKVKNPKYSMRAFARDLKIEQSLLSRILNGKRRLTSEQAFKITLSLDLSPEETLRILKDIIQHNA